MSDYQFILGFKALHDLIPDIIGEPLSDETHNPENGDGLQQTTTGLLVWRKGDNLTAFTDGSRSWINGPNGLETRRNEDRLSWERDYQMPSPIMTRWSSPNCWPGRPFGPPVAIVIHTAAGSDAGLEAVMMSAKSQVSAHFGVDLAGQIDHFVSLESRAWHAGILEKGHRWFQVYLGPRDGFRENPNHWTVGIETEDLANPDQVVTDEQYLGVHGACRWTMNRYPSVTWLLRHSDISPRSRSGCPGRRWTASGRFARLAADLGLSTLD